MHAHGRLRHVLLVSSPRRLIAGAGVLLLAGGGLVGSGANFAATSSNTASMFTAGVVRQTNSNAGAAVLTAPNLAPGGTASGTLDITNSGDLPSVQSLRAFNLVDTPAAAALSSYLRLQIHDLGPPGCASSCPAHVLMFSGTLDALVGTRDLGTFAPGSARRYRFTVSYPDGGAGAENGYGGATAGLDLTWGARQ
jgi:hypothetical protein